MEGRQEDVVRTSSRSDHSHGGPPDGRVGRAGEHHSTVSFAGEASEDIERSAVRQGRSIAGPKLSEHTIP